MRFRMPGFMEVFGTPYYESMRRTEHFCVENTCVSCGLCASPVCITARNLQFNMADIRKSMGNILILQQSDLTTASSYIKKSEEKQRYIVSPNLILYSPARSPRLYFSIGRFIFSVITILFVSTPRFAFVMWSSYLEYAFSSLSFHNHSKSAFASACQRSFNCLNRHFFIRNQILIHIQNTLA